MKRALLLMVPVALMTLTGCGCGLFHRRGDSCQPCGHFSAACDSQQVCHSGVLGGTIIGDGAMMDGGMPVEIQGVRPGPAAEGVAPGRANP